MTALGLTIFVDDGGVMNDNSVRGPQWQRLVSEFFAPRLGGHQESWALANRNIIADEPWHMILEGFAREPQQGFQKYNDDYLWEWLRSMCQLVGVTCPERSEAVALATEANSYITRKIHSDFPGAADAIKGRYPLRSRKRKI